MRDYRFIQADLLDYLQTSPAQKYHAVLSDPPYFLGSIVRRFGKSDSAPARPNKNGEFHYGRLSKGFMGKTWDGFESVWHYQEWVTEWATLLLSFVYPGALGLFFGGTRTYHRLASGLEDAGWEVIDCLMYLYGSGFPKSHNIEGYGTALKPAYESIVVCRAPRGKHTFAQLYAQYGTGLFNIDEARISGESWERSANGSTDVTRGVYASRNRIEQEMNTLGRWPANVILDGESAAALDAMSGELKTGGEVRETKRQESTVDFLHSIEHRTADARYAGDSGGASRFFYCAKAASWEREAGLNSLPLKTVEEVSGGGGYSQEYQDKYAARSPARRNTHPTLKPLTLTEYCARLLLSPAHITERRLLIPFAGVASEMIGARLAGWEVVTGIEREAEYVEQGRARLAWWSQYKRYEQAKSAYEGERENEAQELAGQLPLFAQEAAHATGD